MKSKECVVVDLGCERNSPLLFNAADLLANTRRWYWTMMIKIKERHGLVAQGNVLKDFMTLNSLIRHTTHKKLNSSPKIKKKKINGS